MIKALLADDSIIETVTEKVAEHQVEIPLDGQAFTPGALEILSDDWQVFFLSDNRGRGRHQLSRRESHALCNAGGFVQVSFKGVDYRRLYFIC